MKLVQGFFELQLFLFYHGVQTELNGSFVVPVEFPAYITIVHDKLDTPNGAYELKCILDLFLELCPCVVSQSG